MKKKNQYFGANALIARAIEIVVYTQSHRAPFLTQDLADEIGVHRTTARKWLVILEGYNLVERDHNTFVDDGKPGPRFHYWKRGIAL